MKLDAIDLKILDELQGNCRITNARLAAEAGLSPPSTLERVKRLEKNGVIRQYVALVDPARLNKGTLAFVSVSLSPHQVKTVDRFVSGVGGLPEVLECHHVSGEGDFLLKVVVRDMAEYEAFVLKKLSQIPGIRRVHTSFVLSTRKHSTKVHYGDPE